MRPAFLAAALAALAATAMSASVSARPLTICTAGPYIIFFELGSAELDPSSIAILDNSMENLRNCDEASRPVGMVVDVLVDGHTDTSEADAVSRTRADVVYRYFKDHGIAEKRIKAAGRGAARPRISTPPNIGELRNRRVEIWLEPPPEYRAREAPGSDTRPR